MKKIIALALCLVTVLCLAACSQTAETTTAATQAEETTAAETTATEAPTHVTIKSYNGSKELIDVEIPYDPQRIAILDMAALDIIDALGLGDRVVGSAATSIEYIAKYSPTEENGIANLGTIKAADLLEVAACEPDVIFIGGRLAESYDDLAEIAPAVYLSVDSEKGVLESVGENAKTIASLFGKEEEIDSMMSEFGGRIEAIKSSFGGKDTVVGIYSGSSMNVLGNDGRCSIIGREMGFNNIGVNVEELTSTHGNESSWETIVELDPEYMFILDRNTAINSSEGTACKETVENDLIKELDVYKEGKIVYLANPAVWYTAEGGIQALDIMIQDVESIME